MRTSSGGGVGVHSGDGDVGKFLRQDLLDPLGSLSHLHDFPSAFDALGLMRPMETAIVAGQRPLLLVQHKGHAAGGASVGGTAVIALDKGRKPSSVEQDNGFSALVETRLQRVSNLGRKQRFLAVDSL